MQKDKILTKYRNMSKKRKCVGLLKVCENWVNGITRNKIQGNFTVGIFVALIQGTKPKRHYL